MKSFNPTSNQGQFSPLTVPEYWSEKWEQQPNLSRLKNLKWMHRYLYHQIHKVFVNSLPVDDSKTFLDVGCGSGRWLVYFHEQFRYNVSGIDYSPKAIELAEEVVSLAKVPARICLSNLNDFDDDIRYDIVFSDGFLEHFDKPEVVLKKLLSLVEPGGMLITIIPNLTGLHRSLIRRFGNKEHIFKSHSVITRQQLLDWYHSLGCENTSCLTLGSVLPKLYAVPGIITKPLNIVLRLTALAGVALEGERISSTYLATGTKTR